MKLVSICPYFK